MNVTQIPFAKHIGIEKEEEGGLKLEPTNKVQNHMQTIHAAAQFALAETQSGLTLQKSFPELEGKVVALLRGSSVNYRRPASTTLTAYATLGEEMKENFITRFEKKGRASITVDVELRDEKDILIMIGSFDWFVHKV
ncbi:MAG: DUF4442 domain-containing protein [Sulfurovum sp.]|nr:DUF4442 domain-containing protein [Sulfurovum sp.]